MKGDLMMEASVAMITQNPLSVFRLPFWLLRGKAHLKAQIARNAPPVCADNPPYRRDLLQWLREQKRPLVLAAAAHRT